MQRLHGTYLAMLSLQYTQSEVSYHQMISLSSLAHISDFHNKTEGKDIVQIPKDQLYYCELQWKVAHGWIHEPCVPLPQMNYALAVDSLQRF